LPDLKEYNVYLEQIWDKSWVTNNGKFVQELEQKLQGYLQVPHVQYVLNGTVALQIAIRVLDLHGKIITTPYSYVATTNSILWENCQPVFVDIDPQTFCIDPDLIEQSIDEQTTAILATHVYGFPCDVQAIEDIAQKHDLKVIYDGAHAFGVRIGNKSIFEYGDISITSFHATKLFHTIEGGALMTKDSDLNEKIFLAKAFGHRADDYFNVGINGKNSELHAAMGLCNLKLIDQIIQERKALFDNYVHCLEPLPVRLLNPASIDGFQFNYSYFPVIFENESTMLDVKAALEKNQIFPRRYFYPALNQLPFHLGEACPVAEDISSRVLCLPFYQQLSGEDMHRIVRIVKQELTS